MDRDFLIQLTCELYRITLFFPRKDPLRLKIRDVGTDILANFLRITNFYEYKNLSLRSRTLNSSLCSEYTNTENPPKKRENCSSQILEDLEILESYFELALAQNWVSPKDILEIKKQYYKVREGLETFERPEPKSRVSAEKAPVPEIPETFLKKRQAKILEILKKKGRAQVQDFKKDFPDISKRTLRRDLTGLLEQELIQRVGKRSGTFYEIKARL